MESCQGMIGPFECCSLVTGDARELGDQIPDRSIDLVFTDPPYLVESIELYSWLAEWAARTLKPQGLLMTYCGNLRKDRVMGLLGQSLEYVWDFANIMYGGCSIIWELNIISRWKSILCYRIPGSAAVPSRRVLGAFSGAGADKRFHIWGQDERTAHYYIQKLTPGRGSLVVDPFAGGGTTLAMAKSSGVHWLGIEIDEAVASVARERIETTQMPLFLTQQDRQLGLL